MRHGETRGCAHWRTRQAAARNARWVTLTRCGVTAGIRGSGDRGQELRGQRPEQQGTGVRDRGSGKWSRGAGGDLQAFVANGVMAIGG